MISQRICPTFLYIKINCLLFRVSGEKCGRVCSKPLCHHFLMLLGLGLQVRFHAGKGTVLRRLFRLSGFGNLLRHGAADDNDAIHIPH